VITTPIFLSDGGDLLIFESVDDARGYIEAVDVVDGVYVAYDSQGRLLKLGISASLSKQVVEIDIAEVEPTHQETLRNVLMEFLKAAHRSESLLAQDSLEELVIKSLPYKISYPASFWKWLQSLIRR
jgi:hypothetical protein